MSPEKVAIDLRKTEIKNLEISRKSGESQKVEFSVTGELLDVDREKINNIMSSSTVEPVSISMKIDSGEG